MYYVSNISPQYVTVQWDSQFPLWEMLFYRNCTLLRSTCIYRDFSHNGLVALPGLQHCWKKLILSGMHKQHGSWSGPASTSCTNCLLS